MNNDGCEFCTQRKKALKSFLKCCAVAIFGSAVSMYLEEFGRDYGLLGFALTLSAVIPFFGNYIKQEKVLRAIEKRMRDKRGHTD